MTWTLCWLAIGTGLLAGFAQPSERLQGAWIAMKAERDGKPADDVIGNHLSFTGDRFVIARDGKTLFAGTFHFDANAKPATIDFVHTEGALKGRSWKGIYALSGDTLTVCDNAPDPDKPRPTAFATRAGSALVAVTFSRMRD